MHQSFQWGGADKERFRQSTLGGIEVRYIEDPKHVLYRQYGVYASRPWEPFDIIGEYVGRVVPPKVGGEYVAVFERDDKGYAELGVMVVTIIIIVVIVVVLTAIQFVVLVVTVLSSFMGVTYIHRLLNIPTDLSLEKQIKILRFREQVHV